MNILCASSLTLGREIFSALGDVTCLPESAIDAAAVRDVDVLATRSKVKVNRALLEGSKVRFYGTATAGTDHMDIAWLDQAGLRWTAAPGCNANSVAEYIVCAILRDAVLRGIRLEGLTLAVIGVGQVGRRVVAKARALGLKTLLSDPPREDAEGSAGFSTVDAMLPQADIVTFHVPLTSGVKHPTAGMVDAAFFAKLKPGCLFLNASRGEIVDEDALLSALDRGTIRNMVLDVFDNEPDIREDVLARAELGSPHIAGHSYEGKLNGTVMVYEAACRFLGVEPKLPPSALPRIEVPVDAAGRRDEEVLHDIVRRAYDIERDDRILRAGAGTVAQRFQKHRGNYPDRFEFPCHHVQVTGGSASLLAKLKGLGFASRHETL